MKSSPETLVKKHQELVHSEARRVTSHVQRESDDWYLNTVMIEGCDAPFRYRRRQRYQNLKGQRVNLTYYPASESVAGIELEVMNVVRIKIA